MRKDPQHNPDYENGIHYDQQKIYKQEKKKPARPFPRLQYPLQPAVDIKRRDERQQQDQYDKQRPSFHDITIFMTSPFPWHFPGPRPSASHHSTSARWH